MIAEPRKRNCRSIRPIFKLKLHAGFESHRVYEKDIEFHVKRRFCFIQTILVLEMIGVEVLNANKYVRFH